MRKDELLAELEIIDEKRKKLRGEIEELNKAERIAKSELAEIVTGLYVGDVITYNCAKNAWRLSKMHYNSDTWIEFHGFKLKKDGRPSLKEERIYGLGGPMVKVDE